MENSNLDKALSNGKVQGVQEHVEFFSIGLATELTKGYGGTRFIDSYVGRWAF